MILQDALPYRPWSDPGLSRLPGVMPLGSAPWLLRDEAFAAQMKERDRLLLCHPETVVGGVEGDAVDELFDLVLAELRRDDLYRVDLGGGAVLRPDGVTVALAGSKLAILARLVQEDLLINEKRGDEHVLTAATLLFPSSWTLSEKLGQPLSRIHQPVPPYTPIAARVQRMFDLLRPDQVLWRANWLTYRDADLFQPRREGEAKPGVSGRVGFLRSERQTFRRLPITGAVVFGIHTYVVPLELYADELPAGDGRDHSGAAGQPGLAGARAERGAGIARPKA